MLVVIQMNHVLNLQEETLDSLKQDRFEFVSNCQHHAQRWLSPLTHMKLAIPGEIHGRAALQASFVTRETIKYSVPGIPDRPRDMLLPDLWRLDRFNPANPFVARQRRDVFPRRQ